ncbi:MAG: NUDIX hydrolase [Oscillospiraceae bacterium]
MTSIDTTHDDVLREECRFAKEDISTTAEFCTWKSGRSPAPQRARSGRAEIVVHKGAAAVVPVFENGDTLLVRQHRVAVDRVTLEIPAGKLDSVGEDPLDCAVRELREETGLAAERMTHLTTILTTPGFCTEKIAIYLAQGLSQGETHPDETSFWASSACRWKKRLSGSCAANSRRARRSAA